MRTFACCAASFAEATQKAAGVRPVTSPPLRAGMFDARWLEGWDFLYFDLHGQPGQPFWMGDDGIIALTAELVQEANLGGAVVFAASCYLGDEDSPMLEALLEAGASYVVGGEGPNLAGQRSVMGASLLGLWFRRWLAIGLGPVTALQLAKARVQWRRGKAARDAEAFRAYVRRV